MSGILLDEDLSVFARLYLPDLHHEPPWYKSAILKPPSSFTPSNSATRSWRSWTVNANLECGHKSSRDRCCHQPSERDQIALFRSVTCTWRSPESGDVWHTSRQLKKTTSPPSAGWRWEVHRPHAGHTPPLRSTPRTRGCHAGRKPVGVTTHQFGVNIGQRPSLALSV